MIKPKTIVEQSEISNELASFTLKNNSHFLTANDKVFQLILKYITEDKFYLTSEEVEIIEKIKQQ